MKDLDWIGDIGLVVALVLCTVLCFATAKQRGEIDKLQKRVTALEEKLEGDNG
jgi:hypothetical protein